MSRALIPSSRAGRRRERRSCGPDGQSGREELYHQNVVVVAAVLLQRPGLVAVSNEASLGVKPPRGFVLGDDGELQLLDMTGGISHDCGDKALADTVLAGLAPHIHAPQSRLV